MAKDSQHPPAGKQGKPWSSFSAVEASHCGAAGKGWLSSPSFSKMVSHPFDSTSSVLDGSLQMVTHKAGTTTTPIVQMRELRPQMVQ